MLAKAMRVHRMRDLISKGHKLIDSYEILGLTNITYHEIGQHLSKSELANLVEDGIDVVVT